MSSGVVSAENSILSALMVPFPYSRGLSFVLVHVLTSSSCEDMGHMGLGSMLMASSTLITSSASNSHSEALGIRTPTYEFGGKGHNPSHNRWVFLPILVLCGFFGLFFIL